MKLSMNLLFAALLALIAVPVLADQSPGVSIEELAVQMATTPDQHAIVGNYYRAKAADARAEAERHRSMRRAYGVGKLQDKKRMQEHCDKLISGNDALALEYDQLAASHDALAAHAGH